MHGLLSHPVVTQPERRQPAGGRDRSDPEKVLLRKSRGREPAIPLAVSFIVGIVFDRWWNLPWIFWLIAGIAAAAACWVLFQQKKFGLAAAICLLGCCLCLGGTRHHVFWSVSRADDISLFTKEQSLPVSLTGTIETQPQIYPRSKDRFQSAWVQPDRSLCLLRCESLLVNGEQVDVSGLAQLNVSGHLFHVDVGNKVRVRGWLARPRGPENPGEYDYREYLHRQSVQSVLYAKYPDAVRRTGQTKSRSFRRVASRLRDRAEAEFNRHLSRKNAPVASALLLGRRSRLDKDLRTDFAASGTMHLLAISGLHVGILAGFLWLCCRLLKASPVSTAAVIVTVVIVYAFMTDARPSVIRATLMVVVAVLGRTWYRRASLSHFLAITALIVLVWNPSDLFDLGAQLSFLSMMGIIWSSKMSFGTQSEDRSAADLNSLKWSDNRFLASLKRAGIWMLQGYVMVAAIWLFTLPLVAARFHIFSPVGLLLSVLLSPLFALVLWSGHLLLFCGYFIPPAAPAAGYLFDQGLSFLLSIVEYAARLRFGHHYVPGPSDWWLWGYYALLATILVFNSFPLIRRWKWILLCGWVMIGLTVSPLLSRPNGLRCTFLSVGHGLAVLVELPNGKTLLYDAGSLQNGEYAGSAVQNALWHRGLSRIDTVVISHADLDHYNGVRSLLKTVPVGKLLTSRHFLETERGTLQVFCRHADVNVIHPEEIGSGQSLRMDKSVSLDVLHPEKHSELSSDNARSVVLLIEYAGRRILLTGDLEDDGLDEFLQMQPPRKIDVMLSPHHGSPNANTAELAGWAFPEYVAVSAGRSRRLSNLQETYGSETEVLLTALHGAVTFEISPEGELQCLPMLQPGPVFKD